MKTIEKIPQQFYNKIKTVGDNFHMITNVNQCVKSFMDEYNVTKLTRDEIEKSLNVWVTKSFCSIQNKKILQLQN